MQIVGADVAGMLLDYPVADAEAKTSSLSRAFGSKERIENAIQVGKSRAIVAESHNHLVALECGFNRDLLLLQIADRVQGVVEDVQEHLLEHVLLDHYAGKISGNLCSELNSLTAEFVGAQLEHVIDHRSQRKPLSFKLGLPGKAQEILDDLFHAHRFATNHTQVAPDCVVVRRLREHLGIAQDSSEWIVQLMRSAGDKLTDPCQLFRTDKLLLQIGVLYRDCKIRGEKFNRVEILRPHLTNVFRLVQRDTAEQYAARRT